MLVHFVLISWDDAAADCGNIVSSMWISFNPVLYSLVDVYVPTLVIKTIEFYLSATQTNDSNEATQVAEMQT